MAASSNTSLIIICLIINALYTKTTQAKRPNIVFFLTDDEDHLLLGPRIIQNDVMPNRHRVFVENGVSFSNGYASSPTCCVSRSSILTGKYVHNHHVTNNSLSGNCWNSDFRNTQEPFTYAAYLKNIGEYNTFHAGKYLNRYGMFEDIGSSAFDVPQGWDSWFTLANAEQISYYDYCVSAMGEEQCYGDDAEYYHTKVITEQAMDFLQNIKANEADDDSPFLLVLSAVSAHSPFTVEDKYQGLDEGELAPRTMNWNVVVAPDGNHNKLLKAQTLMSDDVIKQSDEIFSRRLGTLRSLDEAIGEIYAYIDEELNALESTYFIYASDHGFHSGQWGMSFSKMQLYETDIRIPFYLSGPNIKRGADTDVFATTIDIAPTILDMAGIDLMQVDDDNTMDGKSLLWYAMEDDTEEAQSFLIEYHGQGASYDEMFPISSNILGFDDAVTDSWNNSYSCLRWMDATTSANYKYCIFRCYTQGMIECECEENTVEAKGEFFDLEQDPFEMENIYDELTQAQHVMLRERLEEFKTCAGEQCRELYITPIDIEINMESTHKKVRFDVGSMCLKSLL